MTTEEMKQELEASGYQFITNGYFAKGDTYTFRYEGKEVSSPDECIEKAYAHYQEKKRLAALEAENAELRFTLASMTTALSVLANNLAMARKVLGWE